MGGFVAAAGRFPTGMAGIWLDWDWERPLDSPPAGTGTHTHTHTHTHTDRQVYIRERWLIRELGGDRVRLTEL